MNHKVRGFYPFKGLFLQIDIRVCERLLSQMSEKTVMDYRTQFHSLISDFYNELSVVKTELEEYEKALNTIEENEETNTETNPETNPETNEQKKRKALKSGGYN